MLVRLPLAERVEVTLNGRRVLGEKLLRPADLQPGDRATVAHDTRAVRIDAYRVLGTGGVIGQVHVDAGTIDVRVERAARPASFRIGPRCEVTLAGEPAELADLRRGDEVDITHDDPGAASPEPIALVARRPADERRFALLVANQQFDDRRLSPLSHPVPAARPCAPSPRLAGTGEGERTVTLEGGERGLFATMLAAAYAGAADRNRDGRIEPTELYTHLSEAMPREAQRLSAAQTPHLVLPDDRPPA